MQGVGLMTWEKIPCRYCGMIFENLSDRLEHERCHIEARDTTVEDEIPEPECSCIPTDVDRVDNSGCEVHGR